MFNPLKALFGGLLVAGSICLASPVVKADGGDVAAGQKFAEQNCARCHAIGAEGHSPLDQAPPFRIFAKKWPLNSLEEALAEGIVTGHSDMPVFELSPKQIGNFILYLETIQRK